MTSVRPVIAGLIWIGNAGDARNLRGLHETGVRVVVDLAIDEPPAQLSRDLAYCRLPVVDGGDDCDSLLALAVSTVCHCLRSGIPTLVACSGGMSRSPAVVAVALACWKGLDPTEALRQLTVDHPHDVAPAFWARLMAVKALL